MQPKIGDRVKVIPQGKVQVDGCFGRFLLPDGQDVVWSDYYQRRLMDGSVLLLREEKAEPTKKSKEKP